MNTQAKMIGRRKRFGRCRVPGHGSHCEVSREIQSMPVSRAFEKREWKSDLQCNNASIDSGLLMALGGSNER